MHRPLDRIRSHRAAHPSGAATEWLVLASIPLVLAGLLVLYTVPVQADPRSDELKIALDVPTPPVSSTSSTTGGADTSAPRVIGMTPVPGSTAGSKPTAVLITFSEPMRAESLNTNTVKLVRAGGDGIFGNGNDLELTPAAVSMDDATTLRVDLTGLNLINDKYRVRLVSLAPGGSSSTSSTSNSTSSSTSNSSTSNSTTATTSTATTSGTNSATSSTSSSASSSTTSSGNTASSSSSSTSSSSNSNSTTSASSTTSGAPPSDPVSSSSGGTSSGDGTFEP